MRTAPVATSNDGSLFPGWRESSEGCPYGGLFRRNLRNE